MKRVLIRLIVSMIVIGSFFVLIQDFLIFPGLIDGLFNNDSLAGQKLPEKFSVEFVTTADDKKIEILCSRVEEEKGLVLYFHGNGERNSSLFWLHEKINKKGLSACTFDYRGYGASSGWPSEKGLYLDAEAVWKFSKEKYVTEGLPVIFWGHSVGTGTASYLAAEVKPDLLLLTAPYTSIPEVADSMGWIKYIKSFSWYQFPVKDYLGKLDSTQAIIAHGQSDTIIPVTHSERLLKLYEGNNGFEFLFYQDTGHNDLIPRYMDDIYLTVLAKVGSPVFNLKK